jgi:A/G-specific adenine glycosylase
VPSPDSSPDSAPSGPPDRSPAPSDPPDAFPDAPLDPSRGTLSDAGLGTGATLRERLLSWYDEHARDLPWREASASPWAVLVSELMLQQTPVARVLPVYQEWLARWPTPAALAAAPTGEAVRAWGRLGYPRRALRLHAAATAILDRHGGQVPDSYDDLLSLPGVGDYTAAAVASFAYQRRHVVLDTNVRRVLARTVRGAAYPATAVTRDERELAAALLPDDGPTAAAWAVATMELGALVCAAAVPRCSACPVTDLCAWRAAGYPSYDGPARRGQSYDGTDRQCRGRLLAVLREHHGPVHRSVLDAVWPAVDQRERCLQWLVDDALVARVSADAYALP